MSVYTLSCLCFRLYPIGTEVSRLIDKDMQLGGYHIPAGVGTDRQTTRPWTACRWRPGPYVRLPCVHASVDATLICPFPVSPCVRGQGRTQGGRGSRPPPPLGPEKHYIFRVSSVKLRDLHLRSLFLKLFAMWEDRESLQHGK